MKELLKKQAEELARLNSKIIERVEKEIENNGNKIEIGDTVTNLFSMSVQIISVINSIVIHGTVE